jgi:hypothetical protein
MIEMLCSFVVDLHHCCIKEGVRVGGYERVGSVTVT